MDCRFIRDLFQNGVITLPPHVASDFQLADLFTKALTRSQHQFLVTKLILVDNLPDQFEGSVKMKMFS